MDEEACANFILYCCWYAALSTEALFAPGPVRDPIGPTALLDTVAIVYRSGGRERERNSTIILMYRIAGNIGGN